MVDRKRSLSSRAGRAQSGSNRMCWKSSQGRACGGLGVPCSVLVLEHKILGGSLQAAGIPRSVVVPGSTVSPLMVVAAVESWEMLPVCEFAFFACWSGFFSPDPVILPWCKAGVRGSCVPVTAQDG